MNRDPLNTDSEVKFNPKDDSSGWGRGFGLFRGPLHPDLNPNLVKQAVEEVESTPTESLRLSIREEDFNDAMTLDWDEESGEGTSVDSSQQYRSRDESPPVEDYNEQRLFVPSSRLEMKSIDTPGEQDNLFQEIERSLASVELDARSAKSGISENDTPVPRPAVLRPGQPSPNKAQHLTTKFAYHSHTQEVTFQARPTWLALSEKIHSLFTIPLDNVAVSYIDVDGGKVTLNTQEELDDLYQDLYTGGRWNHGDSITLAVLNLGSVRQEMSRRSTPITPPSPTPKSTLAAIPGVEVQNNVISPQKGSLLRASIKEIPVKKVTKVKKSSVRSSRSADVRTSTSQGIDDFDGLTGEDKDTSSIVSVIDSQGHEKKPDIHVLGRQASKPIESRPSSTSRSSRAKSHSTPHIVTSIPSERTLKSSVQGDSLRSTSDVSLSPRSTAVPPVVPTIASNLSLLPGSAPAADGDQSIAATEEPPPTPSEIVLPERKRLEASLPSDIAGLLSTLIASHPELSESIRKISENVAASNYRTPRRETIHSAASLTSIDKEAGKRVAEPTAVRQAVGMSPSTNDQSTSKHGEYVDTAFTSMPEDASIKYLDRPPAHHLSPTDNWIRGSQWYQFELNRSAPPRPAPQNFIPIHLPPRQYSPARDYVKRPSLYPRTSLPLEGHQKKSEHSKELKANVEAAKRLYKVEMERYRVYKEEKQQREERERMIPENFTGRSHLYESPEQMHPPLPVVMPPEPTPSTRLQTQPPVHTSQMASNAHRRYSSSNEIARAHSAPQPTRTLRRVSETVGRKLSEQRSDHEIRAMMRIIERLGDIGVTTRTVPDLVSRVSGLLPFDTSAITVEKEENIAANLVNELLKSPKASSVVSRNSIERPPGPVPINPNWEWGSKASVSGSRGPD